MSRVLADALAGLGPADVVKRVDTLPDQLRTGEIATMVYVVADPGRGRLVVANAGHPPPILIEPSGAARQLEIGHGRLLGLRPSLPRRYQGVTQISSGGHLLLYRWADRTLERAGHDGIAELCRIAERFTARRSSFATCSGRTRTRGCARRHLRRRCHADRPVTLAPARREPHRSTELAAERSLAGPAKTSLRGQGSRAAWRSPRARPPSSR